MLVIDRFIETGPHKPRIVIFSDWCLTLPFFSYPQFVYMLFSGFNTTKKKRGAIELIRNCIPNKIFFKWNYHMIHFPTWLNVLVNLEACMRSWYDVKTRWLNICSVYDNVFQYLLFLFHFVITLPIQTHWNKLELESNKLERKRGERERGSYLITVQVQYTQNISIYIFVMYFAIESNENVLQNLILFSFFFVFSSENELT